MDKQTGNGNTGFTLIEVLLSIFLVALISGVLFASFFLPQRAVNAAKRQLVEVEEAAVFLTRISEELTAACPDEEGFNGTKTSLSFVSSAGTDLGSEAVAYAVKKDEETGTVTVYRKADFPWQIKKEEEQPVLQAEDVFFNYYDGKEWRDDWTQESGIPLLVSVDLSRKGKTFRVVCGPRTGTNPDAGTGSDTGLDRGGTPGLS